MRAPFSTDLPGETVVVDTQLRSSGPRKGRPTVLDVRPTESPLTCLPRSGLSSAHVSSRTRAFNRNKSPHVSRLRGRRSQRRGEVGSWDVSVVDAHQDRSSPKWPSAGRSLLFSKETRGLWTVRGTQNMTAIDNRFCSAPGFLDSGLTVFASTRPRPARRGRVAPGRGFDSRMSPASTVRCMSA